MGVNINELIKILTEKFEDVDTAFQRHFNKLLSKKVGGKIYAAYNFIKLQTCQQK